MVNTLNLIKRPKPKKNILNNREFSEFDSSNSVFVFLFVFLFLFFFCVLNFSGGVAVFFQIILSLIIIVALLDR